MGREIDAIKELISRLSPEELAEFRCWYVEFDALLWDRQLEADAEAGRLDCHCEAALRHLAGGRCTEP